MLLKRIIPTMLIFLLATPIYGKSLDCATNEFRPFGYLDGEKLKGIEVELLQELSKRLNIKINLKIMAWNRMIKQMESGKIDCMFAAFRTDERLEFMDYTSVPIHVSSLVLFVNSEKKFPFKTIDDLKGKVIGLVRGFSTNKEFDAAKKNGLFKVDEVETFDQNFGKLAKKRIDAVLVNKHVGSEAIKRLGLSNIEPLDRPLTAVSAYLTFAKKRRLKNLVPMFDYVLFDLLTDGTYEKIFKSYLH